MRQSAVAGGVQPDVDPEPRTQPAAAAVRLHTGRAEPGGGLGRGQPERHDRIATRAAPAPAVSHTSSDVHVRGRFRRGRLTRGIFPPRRLFYMPVEDTCPARDTRRGENDALKPTGAPPALDTYPALARTSPRPKWGRMGPPFTHRDRIRYFGTKSHVFPGGQSRNLENL